MKAKKPYTVNNQAPNQAPTTEATQKAEIRDGSKYVNTNTVGSKGENPKMNIKQTAVDSNSPYA